MKSTSLLSPAVETVDRIYQNFAKGDVAAILADIADGVEWTDPGASVADLYIGVRRGKAAVRDFFQKLNHHLDITRFEPREYYPNGDQVAVGGYVEGTARQTGRPFASDWAMTFDFNPEGKVARHHLYLDTDDLARAIDPAERAGRAFLAAMDADDLEALRAVVAPDFRIHHPNLPAPATIDEHYAQMVHPVNLAISNARHEVLDACAGGGRLALRGVVTGNHTGSFMGLTPTGRAIDVPWLAFLTVDETGKIRELHVQFNQLSFLAQLEAPAML